MNKQKYVTLDPTAASAEVVGCAGYLFISVFSCIALLVCSLFIECVGGQFFECLDYNSKATRESDEAIPYE